MNKLGRFVFLGIILTTFAGGFFGLTLRTFGASGVSKIINYQGRLYDSNGNLVGGAGTTYCFRFSIYDAPTGGTKLWPSGTPAEMTTTVRLGVFNLGVGDTAQGGDPLTYDFQSNDTTYLNIDVATSSGSCSTFQTLLPRQRITASGYAINAGTVGGYAASQIASGDEIPVLSSGNLTLGGVNPQINATGTNTLTLQGGTGTGAIQFFNSSNYVSATGSAAFAGNFVISGTTGLQGLTFGNATGTGSFSAAAINNTPIGADGAATGIFTNATTTGAFTAQGAGRFESGLSVFGDSTSSAGYALTASDPQSTALFSVRNDGLITIGKSSGNSTVIIGTGGDQNTINIGGGSGGDSITIGTSSAATFLSIWSGVTSTTPFVFQAPNLTGGFAWQLLGPAGVPLFAVGRSANGALDYSRVAVGTTSTLDQFFVAGRINSSWRVFERELMQTCAPTADLTTDTANICGLYFDQSTDGAVLARTASTDGLRLESGYTNATSGVGAALGSGGPMGFGVSNNPVLEARLGLASGLADHRISIGFTDRPIGGSVTVEPTNGVFFVASTTGNWQAVTLDNGSATFSDTGVAASTTALKLFRIEAETSTTRFYI
ncbi:MAG TPA: hypothetical protein VMC43_02475, partial [Candidatus Paceibacterota bacterium]|nr:hypothetical protein [Candidatus Paceibacterota bacterium]